MTRNTDLHNYTVPTTGDEDYDSTFSTYFDNIDRDVPIRDVKSNLSNYTPKSGAKFEATDTENEFIGDGNTWNQLSTEGPNPSYDSVTTGELMHSTPSSFPATWESLYYLLKQGYVVTDKGNVYNGSTAIQDAVDANNGGDQVVILVGHGTFDPVKTDAAVGLLLKGLGNRSEIKSDGTEHALEMVTDSKPHARVYVKDIQLTVTEDTHSYDALHIEATNNVLYETWFENVEVQGTDRHAVNIIGGTQGAVSLWFKDLFGEGLPRTAITSDDNVSECSFRGLDLNISTDNPVIDWDGTESYFQAHVLGKGSGVSSLSFGPNSDDNLAVVADSVYGAPSDSGTDNQWITSSHVKLSPAAILKLENIDYIMEDFRIGGKDNNTSYHLKFYDDSDSIRSEIYHTARTQTFKNGYGEWLFRDSSDASDEFKIRDQGFGNSHIENLSGQTGTFDGQERLDDGTNTPHRGTKCVWDDVNGVWVDQSDGSTFT